MPLPHRREVAQFDELGTRHRSVLGTCHTEVERRELSRVVTRRLRCEGQRPLEHPLESVDLIDLLSDAAETDCPDGGE